MTRIVLAVLQRLTRRRPDFVVGGHDNPYLMRWFIIPRNPVFNIYFHFFLRDDDDRALHDHPWFNMSLLLQGSYIEHTIRAGGVHVETLRRAGTFKFRSPWAAHRIALIDGKPCSTLFITGPKIRAWGFHCPRGWVHWEKFTNPCDRGATVGRGCGDLA